MIHINPIISLAFKLATANAGKAQNGWIILVHWSPQAIAIAAILVGTFRYSAAFITIGAWTLHWPPPDGTKKLTIPAEKNVNTGMYIDLKYLQRN